MQLFDQQKTSSRKIPRKTTTSFCYLWILREAYD